MAERINRGRTIEYLNDEDYDTDINLEEEIINAIHQNTANRDLINFDEANATDALNNGLPIFITNNLFAGIEIPPNENIIINHPNPIDFTRENIEVQILTPDTKIDNQLKNLIQLINVNNQDTQLEIQNYTNFIHEIADNQLININDNEISTISFDERGNIVNQTDSHIISIHNYELTEAQPFDKINTKNYEISFDEIGNLVNLTHSHSISILNSDLVIESKDQAMTKLTFSSSQDFVQNPEVETETTGDTQDDSSNEA